jgi:DNA-binding helix-hairpin-helix protein with protein kinase domain
MFEKWRRDLKLFPDLYKGIQENPAQKKKRLEKEKQAALKEKKRRAKKITMTVGELEDKIEEAKEQVRGDSYYDDY